MNTFVVYDLSMILTFDECKATANFHFFTGDIEKAWKQLSLVAGDQTENPALHIVEFDGNGVVAAERQYYAREIVRAALRGVNLLLEAR